MKGQVLQQHYSFASAQFGFKGRWVSPIQIYWSVINLYWQVNNLVVVSIAFSNCQPYSKEKLVWLRSKEVAAVNVSPSSGPYGCRSTAKSLTRTVNCHGNGAGREVSKTKSSGVTFISFWNRWFTICSLSFGGSFSGVTKVRTGYLSPVLVWGTYLTSHHCKNPNMIWLSLVLFVIWESCRIKDSNFFFKTCLSLPSVLFLLQCKPWWSGRAVKLSPLFHGGREEQRRTKRTPAAGESARAKWGFPSYVFAQSGISSVTHFSHLFELTKCVHNWSFFFLVSKCLVDRWQDKFCNNLLYSYFKLCWFFFELVTFCHILIMVLFSTMLKPDNCHDRAARPPLLFPHYFSWPLPIPLFQL